MDDLDKNEKLRLTALDRAIEAGAGFEQNEFGPPIATADKILEASKKFEAYLKGEK